MASLGNISTLSLFAFFVMINTALASPKKSNSIEYYEYSISLGADEQIMVNLFTLRQIDGYLFSHSTPEPYIFLYNTEGSFLTDEGWYRPDVTQYQQGYKIDKVIENKNNILVLTPYNLDHFNDLKLSITYQWRDITDRKVENFLNIYDYNIPKNELNKIKMLLESQKFPQGSKCLNYSNIHVNKDYMMIYSEMDEMSKPSDTTAYQSLQQYMMSHHITESEVEHHGTWAMLPWIKLASKYDGGSSNIKILRNHKIYEAGYSSADIPINNLSRCTKLNKIAAQTVEHILKAYL